MALDTTGAERQARWRERLKLRIAQLEQQVRQTEPQVEFLETPFPEVSATGASEKVHELLRQVHDIEHRNRKAHFDIMKKAIAELKPGISAQEMQFAIFF